MASNSRRPSALLKELRALGLLVQIGLAALLGFVLVLVVLAHPRPGAVAPPAPCPPQQCTLHAPAPGSTGGQP